MPVWAEVVGNWQTRDSDDNAARATQRNGGLIAGMDHAVGNGWRVGGALGYTDSTLRVDDRNSKSQVSSYNATLYGGKAFAVGAGKLNLLVGAAYSWHSIDSQRRIEAAGLNQSLKADYRAGTSQVFTELGYATPVGNATLEPFAGVAWSDLRTRSFSESGGSAKLSGGAQGDDQTTTTVGLRAQTPFSADKANSTVRAVLVGGIPLSALRHALRMRLTAASRSPWPARPLPAMPRCWNWAPILLFRVVLRWV